MSGALRAAAIAAAVAVVTMSAGSARSLGADGQCVVRNGSSVYGSLQSAVSAAGSHGVLRVSGTCSGSTVVDRDLTIHGDSSATLTVSGPEAVPPALTVRAGAEVTIARVTFTGGGEYGLIANAGTLLVRQSSVSHGSAVGAVVENSGTLTFEASSLDHNVGTAFGGAIDNEGGTVTLVSTSLTDNFANAGGAIYNRGGTIIGRKCEIRDNSAAEGTGGIQSGGGTVDLTDCTLSGNWFGAVSNGGTLRLTRCSVTNNHSDSGGGIATAGTATLVATLVAENYAPFGGGGILSSGTLVLDRGTVVTRNSVDPEVGHGGGIWNRGTLVGAVAGPGGNVYDNTPDDIYP